MRDFLLLISFMSRIPMSEFWRGDTRNLGRSLRLFPLIGASFGFICYAVIYICQYFHVPSIFAAMSAVAVGVLLTKANHLRGAMKIGDGSPLLKNIFDEKGQMVRYYIGKKGIAVAVGSLILKYLVYWYLINLDAIFYTLPAAYIFSRWAYSFAVFYFPTARPQGVEGQLKETFRRKNFYIASALLFVAFCVFWQLHFWITLAISGFGIYVLGLSWLRRYNGLCLECYDAIAEWSEILFLLLYTIFLRLW